MLILKTEVCTHISRCGCCFELTRISHKRDTNPSEIFFLVFPLKHNMSYAAFLFVYLNCNIFLMILRIISQTACSKCCKTNVLLVMLPRNSHNSWLMLIRQAHCKKSANDLYISSSAITLAVPYYGNGNVNLFVLLHWLSGIFQN